MRKSKVGQLLTELIPNFDTIERDSNDENGFNYLIDFKIPDIYNKKEEDKLYYWIEDDNDVYVPGRVLCNDEGFTTDYDHPQFRILGDTHTVSIRSDKIKGKIVSLYGIQQIEEDIAQSEDITEPMILWNIKKRFENSLPYTNLGMILLSVNPYQWIDTLYSEETLLKYITYEKTKSDRLPPHIYWIARQAYVNLEDNNENQAIVISGESGSGKTEATKKCLQYMARISSYYQDKEENSKKNNNNNYYNDDDTNISIEDKILNANPILEAFGNSKTARNNNSSRFGKWMKIQFYRKSGSKKKTIIGCMIDTYLLEKTRIVTQGKLERNYHIFYQLLRGAPTKLKKDLNLKNVEDYRILNQSGCIDIPDVNDVEEFHDMMSAMETVGIRNDEQLHILEILASILHLGELHFETSVTDGKTYLDSRTTDSLQSASNLLGIDFHKLKQSFEKKTIPVRGEIMEKNLTREEAYDSRDAISKSLYQLSFNWLVEKVNESTKNKETKTVNIDQIREIGILDIFGFEIFESNSFEQLCINFANEKLQQLFMKHIFKTEEDLYKREHIKFSSVKYVDNQDMIELVESKQPIGLFPSLNEEVRLPKGSEHNFLKKLINTWKGHTRFETNLKCKRSEFILWHYAGEVKYSVDGFLGKNKDKLHDHLEELTINANNEFVKNLYIKQRELNSTKRKNVTVAANFQSQLNGLMDSLQHAHPHFVRCIKPNSIFSATNFDGFMTIEQLRYSGVFEAVRIMKNGFPSKKSHREFWQKYWFLVKEGYEIIKTTNRDDDKCLLLHDALLDLNSVFHGCQLGKSLMLYKLDQHRALEAMRNHIIQNKLSILGRCLLGYYSRLKSKVLKHLRDNLRKAIVNAKKDRLPAPLQHAQDEAVKVRYKWPEIAESETLLVRLREEFVIRDGINKCLAYDTTKASTNSKDILELYYDLEKLIDNGKILGLPDDTTVKKGIIFYHDIEERAILIRDIRAALDACEMKKLNRFLYEIETIEKKLGSFAKKEIDDAKNMLLNLEKERQQIEKLTPFMHGKGAILNVQIMDTLTPEMLCASDDDFSELNILSEEDLLEQKNFESIINQLSKKKLLGREHNEILNAAKLLFGVRQEIALGNYDKMNTLVSDLECLDSDIPSLNEELRSFGVLLAMKKYIPEIRNVLVNGNEAQGFEGKTDHISVIEINKILIDFQDHTEVKYWIAPLISQLEIIRELRLAWKEKNFETLELVLENSKKQFNNNFSQTKIADELFRAIDLVNDNLYYQNLKQSLHANELQGSEDEIDDKSLKCTDLQNLLIQITDSGLIYEEHYDILHNDPDMQSMPVSKAYAGSSKTKLIVKTSEFVWLLRDWYINNEYLDLHEFMIESNIQFITEENFISSKLSDTDGKIYLLKSKEEEIKVLHEAAKYHLMIEIFNSTVSKGKVKGSVEQLDASGIATKDLSAAIEFIESLHLKTTKAKNYIDTAKIIYKCREILMPSDESTIEKTTNELYTALGGVEASELPIEVREEVCLIQSSILYKSSAEEIKKELNRDLYGPKVGSVNFKHANLFIDNLNDALDNALQANAALHGLKGATVRPDVQEFFKLVDDAHVIKDIRCGLKAQDWISVIKLCRDFKNDNPLEVERHLEVDRTLDEAINQRFQQKCIQVLSAGKATGELGNLNPRDIQLHLLEEAIEFYDSNECKTIEADNLFRTITSVLDLRTAQKIFDWGGVEEVIQKVEKNNFIVHAAAEEEIDNAKKDVQARRLIDKLSSDLKDNNPQWIEGILDKNSIDTNNISEVLSEIKELTFKADYLEVLADVGEIILMTRSALSKGFYSQSLKQLESWDEQKEILEQKSRDVDLSNQIYKEIDSSRREMSIQYLSSILMKNISSEILIDHHKIGEFDQNKIDPEILEKPLHDAEVLIESGYVPDNFLKIAHSSKLIYDIQRGLKFGNWEIVEMTLNSMENDSLRSHYEEDYKNITLEYKNYYAISQLSQNLSEGGVHGEIGNLDLDNIQVNELESIIDKTQNICYTETANHLLRGARIMLKIRKYILHQPVTWTSVRESIDELKPVIEFLPAECRVQSDLVLGEMDNELLIETLKSALKKGGPQGLPGEMDISHVDVSILDDVMNSTLNTTTRTKTAKQLVQMLRLVRRLRGCILRTQGDNAHEAWTAVKDIVSNLNELKENNPDDAGLSCANDEIELVRKEMNLYNATGVLLMALKSCQKAFTTAPGKVITEYIVVEPLEEALKFAQSLAFRTEGVKNLVASSKHVLRIRKAILKEDWYEVKKEVVRASPLENHHELIQIELNSAQQIAHESRTKTYITEALSSGAAGGTIGYLLTKSADCSSLKHAIEYSNQAKINSENVLELIKVGKLILKLRTAQRSENMVNIRKALTMVQEKEFSLPEYVKAEISRAKEQFLYDTAINSLTTGLSTGFAKGKVGEIDYSSIETELLSRAIEEASKTEVKTTVLDILFKTGNIILQIREAQILKDTAKLAQAIDKASKEPNIAPISLSELSVARTEWKDIQARQSLSKALISFSETEISQTINTRKYSFHNMDKIDIDTDTIDVSFLDTAIAFANEIDSTLSEGTRRLLDTVKVMRKLRGAMKNASWLQVQQIFDETDMSQLDDQALPEIKMVKLQLKMRGATVDLEAKLKTGQVECECGFVGKANAKVDELLMAINDVSTNILGSSLEIDVGFTAGIQLQVESLIQCAHDLIAIRKNIIEGDLKAALELSKEGLKRGDIAYIRREISMYVHELPRRLRFEKLAEEMLSAMNSANDTRLERLLKIAIEDGMHRSPDLSFVQSVSYSGLMLYRMKRAHEKLAEIATLYVCDETILYSILDEIKFLKVQDARKGVVESRLEIISKGHQMITKAILSLDKNFIDEVDIYSKCHACEELHGMDAIRWLASIPQDKLTDLSLRLALSRKDIEAACKITIKQKTRFLSIPGNISRFNLENFEDLRPKEEFAFKMMMRNSELENDMLRHTLKPIQTSLTKLEPALAMIAVRMFRYSILGLENLNKFSYPETMINDIIKIGIYVPTLRDEIYCQIIKQLTDNQNKQSSTHLWGLMKICLNSFPPSLSFENYLETFLRKRSSLELLKLLHKTIILKHGESIIVNNSDIATDNTKDLALFVNAKKVMAYWMNISSERSKMRNQPNVELHKNLDVYKTRGIVWELVGKEFLVKKNKILEIIEETSDNPEVEQARDTLKFLLSGLDKRSRVTLDEFDLFWTHIVQQRFPDLQYGSSLSLYQLIDILEYGERELKIIENYSISYCEVPAVKNAYSKSVCSRLESIVRGQARVYPSDLLNALNSNSCNSKDKKVLDYFIKGTFNEEIKDQYTIDDIEQFWNKTIVYQYPEETFAKGIDVFIFDRIIARGAALMETILTSGAAKFDFKVSESRDFKRIAKDYDSVNATALKEILNQKIIDAKLLTAMECIIRYRTTKRDRRKEYSDQEIANFWGSYINVAFPDKKDGSLSLYEMMELLELAKLEYELHEKHGDFFPKKRIFKEDDEEFEKIDEEKIEAKDDENISEKDKVIIPHKNQFTNFLLREETNIEDLRENLKAKQTETVISEAKHKKSIYTHLFNNESTYTEENQDQSNALLKKDQKISLFTAVDDKDITPESSPRASRTKSIVRGSDPSRKKSSVRFSEQNHSATINGDDTLTINGNIAAK